MPLRIAFVTVADLPEGGGRTSRLKTLVNALVKMGHQVTILNEHALTGTPGQQTRGSVVGAQFEYVLGGTDRRFGFASTWMKLRAVFALWRALTCLRACGGLDMILFNQLAFYDTFPLTLWARRHQIHTIQCYEDERLEIVSKESLGIARRLFGLNSWLADGWCSRLADGIIVISTYLQRKYQRLSRRPAQVFLIPTIIDCKAWSCPEETEPDCPCLLYSGSFAEHDEIETVLEALAILRDRGLPFRLLLIGADSASQRVQALKRLAKQLGLEERVEMHGFTRLAEIQHEVCGANILLCIRRDTLWSHSGQSTKLSEYLATGRLVFTSNVGDNPLYVQNEVNAMVVSPRAKPPEIAAALEKALLSRDLRRRLGAEGQRAAERFFDTAVAQKSLEAVFAKILGGT